MARLLFYGLTPQWASILLPLRGAGKAIQRAGGDSGMSALFQAGRFWPAAPLTASVKRLSHLAEL